MARLIHAAALSDSTMVDVVGWALELERSTTARDILSDHPDAELFWAQTLRAASEGADETLSSVRMTLGQKVEPILSRTVMRQMLPADGVPVFDPTAFVISTDTLVLITDDQARTNVAPLTTMLLNEVLDAAKAQAARAHTGRLDPPLRIVGDEIANVAPVPKLPGRLTHRLLRAPAVDRRLRSSATELMTAKGGRPAGCPGSGGVDRLGRRPAPHR